MTIPLVTLGSAVREDGGVLQTGPFGSQLHQSDYSNEGTPVIMPKDISDGKVSTITVARIPEATAERLSRHRIAANGIVLPRRGEVTKRAFIGEEQAGWICGTGCLKIETNGRVIWPRYLYYYLGTPSSIEWLERNAVGTTMLNLSAEIVSRFPIRLPPIATQKGVAAFLQTYDDLMEINQRRSSLLEQAARLLYREWFVHLRFPGRERSKMNAEVPTGWRIVALSDACSSLEDGDWIESKDQGGNDYRLLQISNIGVNEFIETGNYRYVSEETFKRLSCRELLPGHILIARMPTPIGRAWLVSEMPWKMITAVDGAIAVANPAIADPYFLTYFLNSTANLALCERRAVGTTRPRITRRDVASLPLVLPPLRLQHAFRDVVEPINRQRTLLERQRQRLTEARDLLLPRLIHGGLEV